MWLAILFIILGVVFRLIPHVPNFTPLAGIALFSGVYLNKKHGYIIPLAIYIISDFIVGMHNTVFFTWVSIAMIYFLGVQLKKRKTASNTILFTLISSVAFFIVTNFGVWLMGWYPRTLEGLANCYTLAIPFFRTSLLSNLIYVGVTFGLYEYFLSRKALAHQTT